MSDNEDCLSDSDQSDEDFCPENEIASDSEDNNSKESSNDDDNSNIEYDDDDDDSDTKHKNKSNKKKTNAIKINKRMRKRKNNENRHRHNKKLKVIQIDNDNAENNDLESESTNNLDCNNDDKDDKQKSDALWASFLSDVSQTATTTPPIVTKSKTIESNDKSESTEKLSAKTTTSKEENNDKNKSVLLHTQNSENKADEKIKITEILEFAGEEIQIEKEISASEMKNLSKSKLSIADVNDDNDDDSHTMTTKSTLLNKNISNMMNPLKRPLSSVVGSGSGSSNSGSGGFGSILNRIGKKTKISVLEKSKLDWDKFKQNEGLKEELQTYNKGKDGFLERQDFLQRTDVRQFEIESSLRKSKRCSKNNA